MNGVEHHNGRLRILLRALFPTFLLILCLSGVGNAGEVELGMSAAFTGPSRGLGIEVYRGSMAYFEYLNQEKGGVYGSRLDLLAKDDGYNPNPAILNTIHFVEQDNVLLLFNYVGTPTVTRVLPLLKKFAPQHIYMFFPFTGAQPQREFPYNASVYNLRASYRQETAEIVDRLCLLERKRIAVFYQADAYGRSGWDGLRRALAGHDLELIGEASYRRGDGYDADMSVQVDILKAAKPDAVVSVGSYEACAAFIRDARDKGLDVPIVNLSFVGSQNLLNILREEKQRSGRDYTGNLINTQVVPSYEDLSLPAVRLYRKCMDTYAPPPPPELATESYTPLRYSFASFEGFLNAKVLVTFFERFGRIPERSEIQEGMDRFTNVDIGIDVPVSFGPGRHQGLDKVYFTTVEGDKLVPLKNWSRWSK